MFLTQSCFLAVMIACHKSTAVIMFNSSSWSLSSDQTIALLSHSLAGGRGSSDFLSFRCFCYYSSCTPLNLVVDSLVSTLEIIQYYSFSGQCFIDLGSKVINENA